LRKSAEKLSQSVKDIADLSKQQQKKRVQELETRVQKALWFAQRFGLEIDRLEFADSKGQTYGWKASMKAIASFTSTYPHICPDTSITIDFTATPQPNSKPNPQHTPGNPKPNSQ
jgi:hypothetical protein